MSATTNTSKASFWWRTGGAVLTATVAMVALPAAAKSPSSFTESRGYQNCVRAAERDNQIISVDSDYFIYRDDDLRRYYLNGFAFRDGRSEEIKIACEASLSGNRVLTMNVDEGRYAARGTEPVTVARN